jgi:hypothetical protein
MVKRKGCYLGRYCGYLGALNVDCSQTVQSESEPQMTELDHPRDTLLERTRIIQPAYPSPEDHQSQLMEMPLSSLIYEFHCPAKHVTLRPRS